MLCVQILALVEVHLALTELEGRQHVEHLPDVGVCAFDEFVNYIGGNSHLLPVWLSTGYDRQGEAALE